MAHFRRKAALPFAVLLLVMTGCGNPQARVEVRAPTRATASVRAEPLLEQAWAARQRAQKARAVRRWYEVAAWTAAARRAEAAVNQRAAATPRTQKGQVVARPWAAVSAPVDDQGCPYAALIRSVWQQDAEWAIDIAMRESRCQPGALNPSGSAGLFQLLGHQDILDSVCPGVSSSWAVPSCNVRAAWALYQGSGRSPWAL